MTEYAPFSYTDDELRSYLPSGWTLADAPEGAWDAKKKIWSIGILDTTDLRWEVEVPERDVDDSGRLDALKASFDNLYTDRLGRRTKGLGF
jgi:hypothetical protein